jgi:lysine-specific demethylase 3
MQNSIDMVADACMTSILAATMFCTRCGQEYCGDCFEKIKQESTKQYGIKTAPKLLRCFRTDRVHSTHQFYPMSRFAQGELEEAINEMESLLEQSPAEDLPPSFEALKPLEEQLKLLNRATEVAYAQLELESHPEPQAKVPSSVPSADDSSPAYDPSSLLSSSSSTNGPSTPPLLTPRDPEPETIPFMLKPPTQAPPPVLFSPSLTRASVHKHFEGRPKDPSGIDSYRYSVFHYSELTDALFRTIWASGETLVVTGLKDKLRCLWTPESFIEQYGEQQCYITDCVTEKTHVSRVRDFFAQFGKWAGREGKILKLKVGRSRWGRRLANPGVIGLATTK